jgi:hypothetical protein
MEEEIRFCPNCLTETMQAPTYFNPDEPDGGMVWTCSQCLEAVDIIEDTFH